jgi:small subunit ribosomal protein S6
MADATNHEYELIYVVQPDIDEAGLLSLNERIGQIAESQSGSVTATEMWGKRTLAYPIGKNFEGHYVLHRLQMAPTGAAEIDRLLRFTESVMRYLLIRTDE